MADDKTKDDVNAGAVVKPPEKVYVVDRPILGLDFAVGQTVRDGELPQSADRAWLVQAGVLREPAAPRVLPEVVVIAEQKVTVPATKKVI